MVLFYLTRPTGNNFLLKGGLISITLLFGDRVDNVHLEGTVSQNFDSSPSFHFMIKNGKLFTIFFLIFLDFIK